MPNARLVFPRYFQYNGEGRQVDRKNGEYQKFKSEIGSFIETLKPAKRSENERKV